jgi:hypothetical protein
LVDADIHFLHKHKHWKKPEEFAMSRNATLLWGCAALHFYPSGAELKILPLLLPNNKAIYSTLNGTKIQDGSIIGSWNMQG